jgi:micrococcal nuclease
VRRILPVLLLCALTACGGASAAKTLPTTPAAPGTAIVSKQTDGDTIHVTINGKDDRVRFIGIDTPETHGKNGLVECFGKEAAAHTASLIPVGTQVRLVRDAEARDRYGRLLAYVYRASDGLFVNLALARDGYADVLTYPPNVAHADEFVAAVRAAREANRGLWQACGSADVPIS